MCQVGVRKRGRLNASEALHTVSLLGSSRGTQTATWLHTPAIATAGP